MKFDEQIVNYIKKCDTALTGALLCNALLEFLNYCSAAAKRVSLYLQNINNVYEQVKNNVNAMKKNAGAEAKMSQRREDLLKTGSQKHKIQSYVPYFRSRHYCNKVKEMSHWAN